MKLKGPSLSPEASGTLADVLTYSSSNKRAYAKKHATPRNPKSPPQTAVRAMIRFLTQNWTTLSPADIATYQDLAHAQDIARYHAYLQVNMKRWKNFLFPSKIYPSPGTADPTTPIYQSAFDGVASIRIRLSSGGGPKPWGFVTFRSPVSWTTPTWDQCVNVIFRQPTGFTWWTDTPLEPGTYYYRTHSFSDTGWKRTAGAEDSATAT